MFDPKGLRPGAWIRHRASGRFALVESVTDCNVLFWKEEAGFVEALGVEEFPKRWSIFHGYKVYDQRFAAAWAKKGVHVYSRSSGTRWVILGTRFRNGWVMLEAAPDPASPDARWISVRTGGNFNLDFAHLPDRFDRPYPL